MSCLVVSYLKKNPGNLDIFSPYDPYNQFTPAQKLVEHAAISAPHAQKLVKHWFLRAMVPVPLAASQHRPSLLNICHRRHITRCRMYVCPSLSLRVLCVLSSLKTNNRTQSQVSIWGFCDNHNCTLFIRGIISRVHNAQARNARQLTTEWQYRFELS